MSHSPFPYYIDPHVPTAVFDANGWKFAATTPGQMFPEIDPETAADNAALIAAIPAMIEALQGAREHIQADIDDISPGWKSAQRLLQEIDSVLASIGKTAPAK